jgi:hypothetical protein
MINLRNLSINDEIIVYVNTEDADIPFDSNTFLFGFKGGFTNVWTYVVPNIVRQNTRYTQFEIELVTAGNEDPEDGQVVLSPDGNYDYKLWATDGVTLDPYGAYLLDEGQAYLDNMVSEMTTITYISDNDPERNIVYLTRTESVCNKWSTDPDAWNLAVQLWNECN